MTAHAYPISVLATLSAPSWANPPYMGVRLISENLTVVTDIGPSDSVGIIRDRVMIKLTPSSPESPFAGGRVWLLRLVDGYKAWEGWSDAQGYYTATELEVGVEYIAVGIDPTRNHKATGAGPVVATKESP